MSRAIGEFEIASWDEDTYKEMSGGRKLTRGPRSARSSAETSQGEVTWNG